MPDDRRTTEAIAVLTHGLPEYRKRQTEEKASNSEGLARIMEMMEQMRAEMRSEFRELKLQRIRAEKQPAQYPPSPSTLSSPPFTPCASLDETHTMSSPPLLLPPSEHHEILTGFGTRVHPTAIVTPMLSNSTRSLREISASVMEGFNINSTVSSNTSLDHLSFILKMNTGRNDDSQGYMNAEVPFSVFYGTIHSCLLPVCVYDSVKVSCAFVRNMSFVRIQFSTQSHYTSALWVKPPPKPPDGSFEVRRMRNLTKIIESAIGYHMIRCRGDLCLPIKLPSMEFKVLPMARVKFKRVYGTFGIWNEVLLFCYSRMGRTGFGESTELSDAIEDSKELMCSFVSHENHLLLDSRVDYSALSCVSFVAASLSLSGPIYMAIESEELISPEDTCIQIHSIRTDSDSYILVPERKADDLSVLLRNMNDFNEVESSLVCRLQLWTWIKGVQWCPYVKFVDGNFVYDKGKGHKYNKKNDLKITEHLVQDIGELKPTVFCVFPPMLYILFGFKEVILKLAWLGKPPPLPPEICHNRSAHIGNDISISEEKAYRQLFEVLSDPNILDGLDNYSHLLVLHINGKVVQERLLCLTFTGDSNTYIVKGSFSIQEWDEEYKALMIEIIVELECDDNDVDLSVQPNRKITDDPGGSMNSDFGNHGANVDCENGVFELISGEMQFGHHQSFVTDADTHCGAPNEYAFNSDEGQGWSNQPNGEEMISFSHTEAGNRNVEVVYNGFGLDSDSKQAFVFSADSLVGVAGNESSLVKRSGRPKGSKKKVDKISADYLVNQDQSVINISNLAQVKIDVVGRCSIDEVLTPAIFQGDTKGPVTWRETLQGGFNEQKDGMPMLSEISTLEATNCHIDEASLHEVELHTARGVIEPVVLVFLENIPEGLILRQLKASTKIIWKGTFEVTYKFVLEAEITMKRLPTLAESMEEMIYITELCENGSGSLWDQSKSIHVLKLSLDRLKGLVMLAFETAFFILDFSLVDPAFQVCCVNKFYIFSSPRPPEVADLEDKVNFKDGGMFRNEILGNLGELLVFWYNLDMYKTKCKPWNKQAMN